MKRLMWLLIRHTSAAVDRILGAFVRAVDQQIARSNERDW